MGQGPLPQEAVHKLRLEAGRVGDRVGLGHLGRGREPSTMPSGMAYMFQERQLCRAADYVYVSQSVGGSRWEGSVGRGNKLGQAAAGECGPSQGPDLPILLGLQSQNSK